MGKLFVLWFLGLLGVFPSSRFSFFSLAGFLKDIPTPKKISYMWNMGSLLGVFLGMQIMTGLFLSFHYVSDNFSSFGSVDSLFREVSYG